MPLTSKFHGYGSDAQGMALKQLMQMGHAQGLVMAFADVFVLLFVALAALAVMVKKLAGQRPG